MGAITLTVEGTTVGTVARGGGVVIAKTVSEKDSGRLIAAYAQSYASNFTDKNGDPRAPSIEEVIGAWFDGIVAGSVAHVQSVEKQNASIAAADAVPPIDVK